MRLDVSVRSHSGQAVAPGNFARAARPMQTSFLSLRCWFYIVILLAALIAGVAGCREDVNPCAGVTPGSTTQCAYNAAVLQDRHALFPGYLSMQNQISVPLGQPYTIAVIVCGSAMSACNGVQHPAAHSQSEPARLQGRLLVGARILATLAGNLPGQIYSISLGVQPIIARTDRATWMWTLIPSRAGTFNLILTFTPLSATSDSPLIASVSFPVRVMVIASTSQSVSAAFGSFFNKLKELATMFDALGFSTIGGISLWLYQRAKRRRLKARESKATPQGPIGHEDEARDPRDEQVSPRQSAIPSDNEETDASRTAAGIEN
jgi:hypothetical protein